MSTNDLSDDPLAALTPQQRAFVEHYANTGHGTNSAIAAGYAETSAHVAASRLLKRDKIRAALKELLDGAFIANGQDREWLVARLAETVEQARPHLAEVPVYNKDGDPVGTETQLIGNGAWSNKASELLLKLMGALAEKVEHSGGIDIRIEGIPVDDLT